MLILDTAFLTSLKVEMSCDMVGFCRISSHPAGAMMALARLPGSSESGDGGQIRDIEGGAYAGSLIGESGGRVFMI